MTELKQIEPCPEKWGWEKEPSRALSVYFEIKEYGYCCIVFHPYLQIAYYHLQPYENFIPRLKDIIKITEKFSVLLSDLGVEYMAGIFNETPKETTIKLIVKHLGFFKVNNNTYMKYIGD